MSIDLKRKAQSTAEYMLLFTLVIGALTLVQNVVKRALASKVNKAANVYLAASGGTDEYLVDPDKGEIFKGDRVTKLYRASKNAEYTEQRQILHGDGAFGIAAGSEERRITIAGDIQDVKDEVGNVKLDKDIESPWNHPYKPVTFNDGDVFFKEGSEPF